MHHIGNTWLTYFDLTIIYTFCIFQLSYNILTIIKIRNSKNKINVTKMLNAYFYWAIPIVYSIYPVLTAFQVDFSFGLFSIYLRIPPIALILLLVISWTIYVPIFNSKINQAHNLKIYSYFYNDSNFSEILSSHNFFKKKIINYYLTQERKINNTINDVELFKIVADNQGWFIRKDKFSWMWLKNKNKTQALYTQILNNICFLIKQKLDR